MVIRAPHPFIERVPIYMTKRAKKLTAKWPPPGPVTMLPYAPISKNKPKLTGLFPPSQSVFCHGLNTIFLPRMKPPKNFIKQSQNQHLVGVYALRPFYVGFAPFPRLLKKCYIVKGQGIRLYSISPRSANHGPSSMASTPESSGSIHSLRSGGIPKPRLLPKSGDVLQHTKSLQDHYNGKQK